MGFEASMWHGNPGFRAARTRRHYIPVKDRSRKRMTPLAHYFPVPATGTGETMKIRNSFGNTFSGTLGKSMTAAKNKNVNYAREYVIPDNPRSGLQQEHRNAFHAGKEVWNGLRRSQQAFYQGLARADPRAVSGYNIFMERYLFAVKVGEGPEIATVLRWRG